MNLPSKFEIPKEFIDSDGINEDSVSDWLSDIIGWLYAGFTIIE